MPTNPEALPQRASRRTPLYDDLLIVAVIWAMVVIVYHLPLSAPTLDDYTVLPETRGDEQQRRLARPPGLVRSEPARMEVESLVRLAAPPALAAPDLRWMTVGGSVIPR